MKNFTVILVFVFMAFIGNAQWLTPYTTASCGGTGKIANSPGDTTFITYTIGQAITLSGTTSQGDIIGGFQQPIDTVRFCGTIANETRILGPGHVFVCGEINVNNGGILKINPQTTLIFEGEFGINVTGTGQILAEGTEDKPICFVNDTVNNPNTYWKGIRFENMQAVAAQLSTFEYCSMINADVTSLDINGGGMFIKNFPKVSLSHTVFSGCKAKNGGGLAIEYDPFTVPNPLLNIQNCTFSDNQATEAGGGLYLKGLPFPFNLMNYNEFNQNQAANGGGLYLMDCKPVDMNGNFYINNAASESGGAVYVNSDSAKILNSILANNSAQNGGAVYASGSLTFSLYNNTITNNLASAGPAVYAGNSSTLECYNTILWGNETSSGNVSSAYLAENALMKVTNSCIETGISGITGPGIVNPASFGNQYIITGNPYFSLPTSLPGVGHSTKITDWQLKCNSSCINNGYLYTNNQDFNVGEFDILNNIRIDGVIDIGAIEGQTMVYYENDTLRGELEICYNIEVRGGTLTINPGTQLKFLGPYYLKVKENGCIKAIGTMEDSIYFQSANSQNKWTGIILENITTSVDISIFRYCVIEDITLPNTGNTEPITGSIHVSNSSNVEFSYCTVRNNRNIWNNASGIFIKESKPIVKNNYFVSNNNFTNGGVIIAKSCNELILENNYLLSNDISTGSSASIFLDNCTNFLLVGNIVANNTTTNGEYGGVRTKSSSGMIINNTIINNKSKKYPGIYCDNTSTITKFANNIVYDNIAPTDNYEIYYANPTKIDALSSCVLNPTTKTFGLNNPSSIISSYPDFEYPYRIPGIVTDTTVINDMNWSLKKTSACFNAGTIEGLSNLLPIEDYKLTPRICYKLIDIGALETKEFCPEDIISSPVIWGPKIEYICNDVTITEGGSVNIEAGTRIEFQGDYKIQFEGNSYLKAIGTETNPIVFTVTDSENTWKGLRFENITSDFTSEFDYCTFEHANNGEGDGGAISISNVPKIEINHSVFDGCQASARGGAIFAQSSILEISNSDIKNCTAGTVGGGICCIGQFTGDNLEFTGNHANSASGAIYMEKQISFTKNILKNSLIVDNTSMDGVIGSTFDGEIFNCRFYNNESETIFGLFKLYGSHRLYNNLIAHNRDDYSIIDALDSDNAGTDTLYLFNNTIVNNKIDNSGSGTVSGNAVIFATNNILWNNSQNNEFKNFAYAYFSNNCVQGGVNAINATSGAIRYYPYPSAPYNFAYEMFNNSHDPSFVTPSAPQGIVTNWQDLDYSLQENSLLINKGENNPYNVTLPDLDLGGYDRTLNGTVDIGCYETEMGDCLSGIINSTYTIPSGTHTLCGNLEVMPGGELIIQPGATIESNYYYQIKVNGGKITAQGEQNNRITFTVSNPASFSNNNTLEGGWRGIEIVSASDSCIFKYCTFNYAKQVNGYDTIASCITSYDSKVRVELCRFLNNNLGLNFIEASPLVKLSGFHYNRIGAKLYLSDAVFSSDTLKNLSEIGIHAYLGSPLFKENWFDQNANATGIKCELSNTTVYDNFFQYCNPAVRCINGTNIFEKNEFNFNFNSIFIESSPDAINAGQVKINKNRFHGGHEQGTEIYCNPGLTFAPEIVISNNVFTYIDGLYINLSVNALVINNHFTNNAWDYGPVIRVFENNSSPVLTSYNNIFWYNDNPIFITLVGQNASANIGYCCIEGGTTAISGSNINYVGGSFSSTNISANPNFVAGTFKLSSISPCRNTGTPVTDLSLIGQKDYYENWRIMGGRIDMGYHEYGETIIPVADFSATPRKGIIPFTVHFSNLSIGENLQYEWDLNGEGQINSTDANPTFVYNQEGSYDISLAVHNSNGFSTKTKDQCITAYQIPNYMDDFESYATGSSLASIVYWDVINAQNAPQIELAPSINSQAVNFTDKWAMMQLGDKTQGVYEISFNWLQLPNTTTSGKINIDNTKQNEEILLQSKFVGNNHQIEISVLGIDFDYSISVPSENLYKHYNFKIDFEAKKIYFFLNNVLKFTYSASEHGDVFLNKLSNLYLEGGGYLDNFSYVNLAENINLSLTQGWQGISLYNDPNPASVEQIFAGLNNNLIILYNYGGIYQPAQGINTIGDWDNNSGYALKMNESVQHQVNGWRRLTHQLNLNAGWNICPVLSSCQVPVAELFAGIDVQIVKDVAGYGVYWPQYGINTIGSFNPGKAYFVRANSASQISFPQCDNKKDGSITPAASYNLQLPANLPWAIAATTAISHTIAIRPEAFVGLNVQKGSVIGAFDDTGNCFGIVDWLGSNTSLSLFGNDQLTYEKDGFEEGDQIHFRLFDPSTEKTSDLLVEFSLELPQADGRFYGNGLSLIKEIALNSAGVDEMQHLGFKVYPNPADATLNVSKNFDGRAGFSLINIHGKTVFSSEFDGLKTEIDVSGFAPGVYIIELKGNAFSGVKRLVIK